MLLQCGTITYSAILINLNLFRGVQPVLCVMTTDRHPASHPCYRDSLGTLYNSDVLTTESGCFTAYAAVWLQYHLITSSRPQLLPEDTKPATCKSDATPDVQPDVLSKRSPTMEPCTFRYLLPRT